MKPSAIILAFFTLGCWGLDRSTENGEAAITDPQVECSPYSYPLLVAQRVAFPTSWKPASILQNDSDANARWQSIASSVPNTQPKPAPGSSGASTFNYKADDPDCWWTRSQCTTPKLSGLPPDIANVPEPSTMGYGFDDGPNCSHNAFYDYLASKNQKATMFFVGSNVMDWPLEAQRALADGHEICVHTWSHSPMTSLSSPSAFAELYYTVVGVTPTCWRPPYGDVDDRIRAIANGLGLRTILWKYDSNDWRFNAGGVTKAQIDANYQSFINQATTGTFSSAGAIILTHELNNFTMQESMDYYDQLKSVFKYIVPVAVALNKTQPYVEKNYTLPTFEQCSGTTTVSPGSTSVSAEPSRSGGGPTQSEFPQNKKSSAATTILTWSDAAKSVAALISCLLLY
ncbi:Chitin deacetylase [Leucoagaricus sp. SymC.cos]|nr:Chitin deacetylase [Leucoagaricus sp. SymC.cos]